MRKGILLTNRDCRVLYHLSKGPAAKSTIYRKFFRLDGSSQKTRERVTNRRLEKLENGGLVRSVIAPTFREPLYVLTKDAVAIVSSRFGLDTVNIWVNLNMQTIEHDACIAGTARMIEHEATEKNLYDVPYLALECFLKRQGKVAKGEYFPDLRFTITDSKKTIIFDLEGDCGSVSRKDFLGKMNFFPNNVLVLASTRKRLDLLLWYLNHSDVRKPVMLALFEDLFNNSLLDCQWHLPRTASRTTLRQRFFGGS
jgi:hypothetical protein